MIIKYTNFSNGIDEIMLTKSVGDHNLPEEFIGDVTLECVMDKSITQIVLNCKINAEAKLLCDRCNEEYHTELENEFKVIYFLEKEEGNEEDSNIKYLLANVDKIKLNDDVMEYSLLSVPMKKLCKVDCKGLCSSCGTNLNISKCDCKKEIYNPVWDKLSKMRS